MYLELIETHLPVLELKAGITTPGLDLFYSKLKPHPLQVLVLQIATMKFPKPTLFQRLYFTNCLADPLLAIVSRAWSLLNCICCIVITPALEMWTASGACSQPKQKITV